MNKSSIRFRADSFRQIIDDFRFLDAKEIGSWPLAPRLAALIGLFALVIVLAWWIDWGNQFEALKAEQQQEAKLKEEYLVKKAQAINLAQYRKQLIEIDRSFGALLRQLPDKSEMEALIVDFYQSGIGRGLNFELFKPGEEVKKDFYAELPITVRVVGSYHDLGAFVGDVGQLSRIITLGELAVEAGKERRLKLDAVAMTYRYLDEEEITLQKKATKSHGGKK